MGATEIPLLVRSDKEQALADWLHRLEFPRDYDYFMMLPLSLIKQWIVGLDPKVAIVVACDPEFKKLFAFKNDESFIGRGLNWCVRRIHGLDF